MRRQLSRVAADNWQLVQQVASIMTAARRTVAQDCVHHALTIGLCNVGNRMIAERQAAEPKVPARKLQGIVQSPKFRSLSIANQFLQFFLTEFHHDDVSQCSAEERSIISNHTAFNQQEGGGGGGAAGGGPLLRQDSRYWHIHTDGVPRKKQYDLADEKVQQLLQRHMDVISKMELEHQRRVKMLEAAPKGQRQLTKDEERVLRRKRKEEFMRRLDEDQHQKQQLLSSLKAENKERNRLRQLDLAVQARELTDMLAEDHWFARQQRMEADAQRRAQAAEEEARRAAARDKAAKLARKAAAKAEEDKAAKEVKEKRPAVPHFRRPSSAVKEGSETAAAPMPAFKAPTHMLHREPPVEEPKRKQMSAEELQAHRELLQARLKEQMRLKAQQQAAVQAAEQIKADKVAQVLEAHRLAVDKAKQEARVKRRAARKATKLAALKTKQQLQLEQGVKVSNQEVSPQQPQGLLRAQEEGDEEEDCTQGTGTAEDGADRLVDDQSEQRSVEMEMEEGSDEEADDDNEVEEEAMPGEDVLHAISSAKETFASDQPVDDFAFEDFMDNTHLQVLYSTAAPPPPHMAARIASKASKLKPTKKKFPAPLAKKLPAALKSTPYFQHYMKLTSAGLNSIHDLNKKEFMHLADGLYRPEAAQPMPTVQGEDALSLLEASNAPADQGQGQGQRQADELAAVLQRAQASLKDSQALSKPAQALSQPAAALVAAAAPSQASSITLDQVLNFHTYRAPPSIPQPPSVAHIPILASMSSLQQGFDLPKPKPKATKPKPAAKEPLQKKKKPMPAPSKSKKPPAQSSRYSSTAVATDEEEQGSDSDTEAAAGGPLPPHLLQQAVSSKPKPAADSSKLRAKLARFDDYEARLQADYDQLRKQFQDKLQLATEHFALPDERTSGQQQQLQQAQTAQAQGVVAQYLSRSGEVSTKDICTALLGHEEQDEDEDGEDGQEEDSLDQSNSTEHSHSSSQQLHVHGQGQAQHGQAMAAQLDDDFCSSLMASLGSKMRIAP